jgi:hypothetical protein
MSVTHPDADLAPVRRIDFASAHPQLTPFVVAVAIFAVSLAVALAITGLPA